MTNNEATYTTVKVAQVANWVLAGNVSQFPSGVGGTIKYGNRQVAVFYFARRDAWYACQNLCPHKLENVLGRGLTGVQDGIPKIACPLHKKAFSLEDGKNLNGDCPPLAIYPVRVENDLVYVGFAD
ncbi:nitrite reductase small subunit [Lewinella sp. 4G2]|nr:nitrite reductase small subunit [Lewinella sp. 4G2]